MSNNDQNQKTWIQRVKEYEGGPEEQMSDEEAWARLQQRFTKDRQEKRKYFFWAAAACIIFLFIPLLMKFMRHNNSQFPRDLVEKPRPKLKNNAGVIPKDTITICKEKNFIENAGYEKKDNGLLNEDEFHPGVNIEDDTSH